MSDKKLAKPDKSSLFAAIKDIDVKAKQLSYKSSNTILLNMYWEIGHLIVKDEQGGKAKASYGKAVLKNLSRQLSLEFGKGFDESNLRNIRQFYLAFQKRDAVRHELSWTHYRILSRLENEPLRDAIPCTLLSKRVGILVPCNVTSTHTTLTEPYPQRSKANPLRKTSLKTLIFLSSWE